MTRVPDLVVDHSTHAQDVTLQSEARLKDRLDAQLKEQMDVLLAGRGVTDLAAGGSVSVKVTLEEPELRYNFNTGQPDFVFFGNPRYKVGDIIKKPEGGLGGGGNGAGLGGGDGEDDFIFQIPTEELTKRILEGLKLPNMKEKRILKRVVESIEKAGHRSYGPPATLNVVKTVKQAHARRLAFHRPSFAELEDLEEQIAICEASKDEAVRSALPELGDALAKLLRKRNMVPYFDKGDLRYRRKEVIERPITAAVMFNLMDKSGSMTEHRKDLAKRFFWLLRFFLQSEYETVIPVWIQHTDTAQEVDENTFFHGRESGGTVVSSALEEMLQIQKERFPVEDYNIYCCQAGDGDTGITWIGKDDAETAVELLTEQVLPMSQYYAYIECHESGAGRAKAGLGTRMDNIGNTRLWDAYGRMHKPQHFAMKRVAQRSDIYPVFRRLFSSTEADAA